ncbi:MAG: cobalt ABC transporter permease [Actinobacteria bacterium]|nr:cobalt ABC transporter permease [Actinomycetota bacterium]
MHVPDGFINAPVSAVAGLISISSIWTATKAANRFLADKLIAIAGMMSALIFVLQMINFPIAAGTSGHLLGGTLAVIVLGPSLGILCVSIVVILQALLFADGGLSALGINILNIAIITGLIGWLVISNWKKIFGDNSSSIIIGSFIAGMISVIMSSIAFVIEYFFGGTVSVDIGSVFFAMVSSHFFIGIGEGIITALIVSLLLRVRPDMLYISREKEPRSSFFSILGLLVLIIFSAVLITPLASSSPDGLEDVASRFDFESQNNILILLDGYLIPGVNNNFVSVILSGILGIIVVGLIMNIYLNVNRKKSI